MYFLIDGENIDATLGVNILKRAPQSEERPRWDRVLAYNPWDSYAETKGLFYLNASERTAMPFVQALLAIGWQPILLTSDEPGVKVVDRGIQLTLEAIRDHRPGEDIIIASHDVDYLPQIVDLLDAGHRVAIVCFREFLSTQLSELESRGLMIIDLEYEVDAFNQPLNRIYPMSIDQFDPLNFI